MEKFEYEFTVEWGHCDPAGIVFYPNYYVWFDAGSHRLMTAAGFGLRQLSEKYGIIGPALVSSSCGYKKPVSYGDILQHSVRVSEWGERVFVIAHTLTLAGEIAADGHEKRICLKREADGRIRAIPVPSEFRHAIESLCAS